MENTTAAYSHKLEYTEAEIRKLPPTDDTSDKSDKIDKLTIGKKNMFKVSAATFELHLKNALQMLLWPTLNMFLPVGFSIEIYLVITIALLLNDQVKLKNLLKMIRNNRA